MRHSIIYGAVALICGVGFSACTDPETVDLNYDTISEANPELYAEYLAGLRAYRDNGHKKVYAWFDNQSGFISQADHVSAVPDSIDVLVFHNPDVMPQPLLDEINAKRSDTGMQTAYMVDYAAIRKAWELKKELETPEAPVPLWSDFMKDSLNSALGYFNNGGFDRIICAYNGRMTSTLTPAEKSEYLADQATFLSTFSEWQKSHLDKGFDFLGIPSNVADPALLNVASVIFLSESAAATNVDELKYIVNRNSVDGVPVDKFAVVAALPVLDETQGSVGYWGDEYSSWLTARWARTAEVTAIGLYNLRDDYFNPAFIYPVCRGAIQILNPAAR